MLCVRDVVTPHIIGLKASGVMNVKNVEAELHWEVEQLCKAPIYLF